MIRKKPEFAEKSWIGSKLKKKLKIESYIIGFSYKNPTLVFLIWLGGIHSIVIFPTVVGNANWYRQSYKLIISD